MTELETLALESAFNLITKAVGIAVDAAAVNAANGKQLLAELDAKVQSMAAQIAAVKFKDV
jgi:hypothetical protein